MTRPPGTGIAADGDRTADEADGADATGEAEGTVASGLALSDRVLSSAVPAASGMAAATHPPSNGASTSDDTSARISRAGRAILPRLP